MDKIIAANGRDDPINQHIQDICKSINGLLQGIGERNKKINLMNQ